jgi:hypothetical protein
VSGSHCSLVGMHQEGSLAQPGCQPGSHCKPGTCLAPRHVEAITCLKVVIRASQSVLRLNACCCLPKRGRGVQQAQYQIWHHHHVNQSTRAWYEAHAKQHRPSLSDHTDVLAKCCFRSCCSGKPSSVVDVLSRNLHLFQFLIVKISASQPYQAGCLLPADARGAYVHLFRDQQQQRDSAC